MAGKARPRRHPRRVSASDYSKDALSGVKFGDVEYLMGLGPELGADPVARLGVRGASNRKTGLLNVSPMGSRTAEGKTILSDQPNDRSSRIELHPSLLAMDDTGRGNVMDWLGANARDTLAHEFGHAGSVMLEDFASVPQEESRQYLHDIVYPSSDGRVVDSARAKLRHYLDRFTAVKDAGSLVDALEAGASGDMGPLKGLENPLERVLARNLLENYQNRRAAAEKILGERGGKLASGDKRRGMVARIMKLFD